MSLRGLVLAGGRSRRFGRDKAMARYDGMSFLDRAVGLLKSLDLKPVVVTRRDADYAETGCPVIYDKLPEKGPLGGLYTALTVFNESSFLVLTCDMPQVTLSSLDDLLDMRQNGVQVTVYRLGEALQPFPGIYEASVLPLVREQLKQDNLSMKNLLQKAVKRTLEPRGGPDLFDNINYIEDLSRIEN